MTRITKRGISESLSEAILSDFLKEIKQCKTKDDIADVLNKLFTPEEQIMAKKRLGIIFLYGKGKKKKEISELLDVTRMTIDFVIRGLKKLPQKPIKKSKKISRNDYVEKLRRRRWPTYSGKDRWNFLNKPDVPLM
jgi:DNA-directed RNA polymerase sigma subunit (sigma70/sigma32)